MLSHLLDACLGLLVESVNFLHILANFRRMRRKYRRSIARQQLAVSSSESIAHVADILWHHGATHRRPADWTQRGIGKFAVRKFESGGPIIIRKLVQHRRRVVVGSVPGIEAHSSSCLGIDLELWVDETGIELCERLLRCGYRRGGLCVCHWKLLVLVPCVRCMLCQWTRK